MSDTVAAVVIKEPNRKRSLTYIRMRKHFEDIRNKEIEECDEFEACEVYVRKLLKNGKPDLKNGMAQLEKQQVLKRDAIRARHDQMIEKWDSKWEGVKG